MFAVKSLSLGVLLALASTVIAHNCVRDYTVATGDTCDSISAARNVSTYQLAATNPGVIDAGCGNLEIGQTLCLGREGEDCTTTYIVKANDDCSKIAGIAGVNTTMLMLNNPQIDESCSNIYIGEVLCIASIVQCPPVPPKFIDPTPPKAQPATPPPPPQQPAPSPPQNNSPAPPPPDNEEDLPYCDEIEDGEEYY